MSVVPVEAAIALEAVRPNHELAKAGFALYFYTRIDFVLT
jgi:hypothetical protein